jgi:hypothetical protein
MPTPLRGPDLLDREFLGIRSRLIDLAASLDRIDRAEGTVADDPRVARVRRSLEILLGRASNRAEQLQQVFSLAYENDWMDSYGLGKQP